MGVPKSLDYKDFMNKSTSANPTTWDDMYRFFGNQGEITAALVKSLLYQPGTAYSIGAIVYSPNLPAGTIAKCTVAGTTGSTEPVWPAVGFAVYDGTARWIVENIRAANIPAAPDLTAYMKKDADSDLSMNRHKLVFLTGTISYGLIGNQRPGFIIDASNSEGLNIKAPNVLVNESPIATKTDLSGKLDKTDTAAAAIKATQDGEGNVIATTYIKTVNNLKPDISGNVNISTGGTNVVVDTTLSSTSNNPIANKAVYAALNNKLDKNGVAAYAIRDSSGNIITDTYAKKSEVSGVVKSVNNISPDSNGNVNISGGAGGNITVDSALSSTSTNAIQNRVVQQEFTSVRAAIPIKVSQLTNDSGYLTQHQSLDGYVKTVNNTAPDNNGNVTIALSGGGGVSTSESNTWTGKQTFQKMKFNFESYNAPRISGAIDNPSESVAVYNVSGDFTLDMSELAKLLSNGDATVFTAYITANGSYALSITNAGTLKYAGSATDLAITAKGLLLNIMLIKSSSGVLSSVAQASALS